MLSRLLPKPSHFRFLPLLSSKSPPSPSSSHPPPLSLRRLLSTNGNHNNDDRKDQSSPDPWTFSQESYGKFGNLFSDDTGKKSGDGDWLLGEEEKAWSFGEEEKDDGVFDLKEDGVRDAGETVDGTSTSLGVDEAEERKKLEEEEKQLTAVLKGPNRAFGDLIAASGITDAMLDSLIALKDLEGVDGLPPLSVIEDMRYEKNTRKSTRAEMERLKLEEMAKERVRQVDDKGRAYGTGRRKCSIARVWVEPGDGKFIINDKEFDVYFPMLDHRAALLRPFSETKTLGLWDIKCTVKGGGLSGQVGAIQLGISRALQNFEPDLRPPLRAAGFLTRDSRVVERKKPGKAKARKSFQWVKR
ncbi:Ribosomal Protein S9 M [Hibiscus trionum]|uniref:Ribosomal Protein S9 M n=1 Tax=Hibiscus trionum TaxID=183268 RepID=A0A9W7H662_HIBTR|nr:Ribosomal Protein S9 M [Hibiscus trionum]